MSDNEEEHGFLKFLPKSGKPGVVFGLTAGKSYIGSSIKADIRLKVKAADDILCIVDVTKNGIATVLSKSSSHPVYVNSTMVEKFKVLHHEDKISILGKCFQYCNDKISKEDVDSFQTQLYNAITTPSKTRKSIAAIDIQSTKKSPNFKTKTSLPKTPSYRTRQTFETPDMKIVGNKERPKTTSKLIVSKALCSDTSTKKRRLSMDDNPKRTNRVPKVSERNILLFEKASSKIDEEDSVPSLTREKVACGTMDFLDLSNISVPSEESLRRESLRRRSSMRTPSRSSFKPQTLTDRTNLTGPEMPTPVAGKSFQIGLQTQTPRKNSKLDRTPSTSTKIATPGKILKNTPRKLLKTPATEDKTPAKSDTPKLYKSILVNKSLESTRYSSTNGSESSKNIKSLTESSESPSSSNVPNAVKKRPKSQGSVAPSMTSTIKRRKSEGNPLDARSVATPKKYHTNGKKSISIDEGVEISDYSEIAIPLDPRLSLGKASPRKSVRVSQRLNGPSWQSAEIEDAEENSGKEEYSDSSEKSVEKLNSLDISRSTRPFIQSFRDNLVQDGEDGDSSAESLGKSFDEETWSNFNTRLRESARQDEDEYHSRKSSMTDEEGDETEGSSLSEDEQVEDADILASTEDDIQESSSSSDPDMEKTGLQLRKSARMSDQMRAESDMSGMKSIFVPQCRPPVRSYGRDANKLSISLRKSNTPQKLSTANIEVNQNDSSRVSLRSHLRRSSVNRRSTSILDRTPASGNDSALSESDQSIVTNNNSQSESDSEVEYFELDSQRKRSLPRQSNKTPLHLSLRNSSVITVDDDSIKNTPENNTSIVIVDTPFEKPPRKPSKTLNSSIEDCVESSTPKSVIKGRRTKSIPYRPVVEEITPATPDERRSKGASGFKTPLNTPGLFEDIKQSVLRSRSRRSTSSNLREELDKAAPSNAEKRARESTGSTEKSAKKRRVMETDSFEISTDEEVDASFGSFGTDEIFTDEDLDQEVAPNTPQDFKNLTDKPLITIPKTRSMTEPKKKRSAPKRLSLQAVNLRDQMTESDETVSITSPDNSYIVDSAGSSKGSSRSSSRLSDRQKKTVKPPKNDLTDVRGVKRLMKTPKPAKPPKNDLTNIVGVKKMFSTPNIVNSPKNDLTRVPNLRRLVYSVRENSPNNDLSDVAGIKRLLSTPKDTKSPKNDLRNIPNLRRIMSPKQQNSPKNDLSDVAGLKKLLSTPKKQKEPRNDLRSVHGVKKLLSTPKKQKSPVNDLTKVPNLRRIMSPKQQNSPANDLRNIDGIADIFVEHSTESDVEKENNEDLFEKLFVRKPLRTYTGRSVSPITRKASIFGGSARKSVGDLPHSSPRIEKWLEDQAVVKLERVDEGRKDEEPPRRTGRPRKKAVTDGTETELVKKPKTKLRTRQVAASDESKVESPRRARQKRTLQKNINTESMETNDVEDDTSVFEVKVTRSRRRRASQTEEGNTVKEKPTRRKASKKDEVENTDTESVAQPNKRGIVRTVSVEKVVETPEPKRGNRRRGAQKKKEDESVDTEMAPPLKTAKRGETEHSNKGRNMLNCDTEISTDSEVASVSTRRGRAKGAVSSEELEPAKLRSRRKVTVEETVEPKEEDKEGVEMQNNKKKGSRKNQKPEPVPEEPEKPASKGGRRKVAARKAQEPQEKDEEIVEVKTTKKKEPKVRKQAADPAPEETSTPVRSIRRQKIIVIEDSTDGEEDKENAKENINQKTQPKRRNVKAKPSQEVEEPAKRSNRSKAVTEDPEDTPKDLPKTQIDKTREALLSSENSPRTREKKGNFKKYGEDFITEKANVKKVVRFEEDSPADGAKNKRKGKAAEETLRRSKRTNK